MLGSNSRWVRASTLYQMSHREWLARGVAWLLVFAAGASYFAAASKSPSQAAQPRGGELTVSGVVVMPDGSPAAGAKIASRDGESPAMVVVADEHGRFRLSGVFGSVCHLHARSADQTLQTALTVPASTSRAYFTNPVELKLAPARRQMATVTASGKPVGGARVVAVGGSFKCEALTAADGEATLWLPGNARIHDVVAWHPELGVAGKSKPTAGVGNEAFELSLLNPKPHIVRVVDEYGSPVSRLTLRVSVGTKQVLWIPSSEVEAAHVATDDRGEAHLPWVPRDVRDVLVDVDGDAWKLDAIEQAKASSGTTLVRVRRKVPVEGRLTMPDGVSAEGILVTGVGYGSRNVIDQPTARARADGSFLLTAATDHGYLLGISDQEWAGDFWTGLILPDDVTPPASIAIETYRAAPTTIRVARGENREPVANALVWVHTGQEFSWQDSRDRRHYDSGHISQALYTDASGLVRVGLGKGKHNVSLKVGDWGEKRMIEVDSAAPVAVDFYRRWLGKRTITGRLTVNGTDSQPSPTATIEAWTSGEGEPSLIITRELRPDGTFALEADANDISMLVRDRKRRLSGFVRIGPESDDVQLPLVPTATYSGTATDGAGQPVARQPLRLVVSGTNHLAAAPATSDEHGKFRFEAVATDVPVDVKVVDHDGQPLPRLIDRLYFVAGETRENARLVVDNSGAPPAPPPDQPYSLAEAVARAVRDARLNGMQALVILQGDSSKSADQLASRMQHAVDELPEVVGYLPLVVRSKSVASSSGTLAELGWPPPQSGEAVLVALDEVGKKLGVLRVPLADDDAAPSCAPFLRAYLPPVRDARALWESAREAARRAGKNVWVVEGGSRCAPCRLLTRWMDDQHALLEKDYVVLKINLSLDRHAAEVMAEVHREPGGIPWSAITDADGNVLATSDGPLGNIGFPNSIESRRHLRAMLDRTAHRLSAEQRDRLVKSIKAD
jgi:hypothetical protein